MNDEMKIVVSKIDLNHILSISNIPGILLLTRVDLNNDVAGHVRFNVVYSKAIQGQYSSRDTLNFLDRYQS